MITEKNILCHELIGLKARIEKSLNKSLEGIEGIIIDETKKTITIETEKGKKIIPKDVVVLAISVGSKNLLINGRLLLGRPEERIKKNIR